MESSILVLIGLVDLVFLIWLLGCEDDRRLMFLVMFSAAVLLFSNHGL
jgi:hypothetical protein